MITRADEYPIHQTTEPIARAADGERNFYDRYFFNGYSRDGEVFFAVALGHYPNRKVIDGAFSVVHHGRQFVVRASARAETDRMNTRVGPIAIEVLEPLRTMRVSVQPNPWDISGDLIFTGRVPPLEEPHFLLRHDGHTFMDYTRMTQHVDIRGTLNIAGDTIELAPDRYWGARDRSWGIRPVGERDPDAVGPLQFFWLWSPVNFEKLCTHFDVNELADGRRWHTAAALVPIGGGAEEIPSVDYRIDFRPGTRHADHAELYFRRASGEELTVRLDPLYNFSMSGLGYLHPTWGLGMAVGENETTGESWDLADVDPTAPLHWHVQAVCRATLGRREGIGVLEQLIIGPHSPSGFSDLFDLAP